MKGNIISCYWRPVGPRAHYRARTDVGKYPEHPQRERTDDVSVLAAIAALCLWHVDTFLGDDREISNYTTAAAK
jgi:hypothetical protein